MLLRCPSYPYLLDRMSYIFVVCTFDTLLRHISLPNIMEHIRPFLLRWKIINTLVANIFPLSMESQETFRGLVAILITYISLYSVTIFLYMSEKLHLQHLIVFLCLEVLAYQVISSLGGSSSLQKVLGHSL